MSDQVVNLRDFRRSGSQSIDLPPDVVRIDRHSPWGNPFRIGDRLDDGSVADRARVLKLYRIWLRNRVRDGRLDIEPLRGKRLACWCAPLPCHGDVIAELLSTGGIS